MLFRPILFLSLLVPAATTARAQTAPTPSQPCKSTVTGTLETIPFASKVYGDQRLLRVWLPTGYTSAHAAAQRYPVLYLFDGQFLFDRCTAQPFPDEWHVDEILTGLIATKAVQPFIVVGIDNAGPGRRENEYSRHGAMADAPQKLSAFMTTEVLPLQMCIRDRKRCVAVPRPGSFRTD